MREDGAAQRNLDGGLKGVRTQEIEVLAELDFGRAKVSIGGQRKCPGRIRGQVAGCRELAGCRIPDGSDYRGWRLKLKLFGASAKHQQKYRGGLYPLEMGNQ